MKSIRIFSVIIAACAGVATWSADIDNIQDDISRVGKELAQVQEERARNRQEVERDRTEQDAYEQRTRSHRTAIAAETDSVKLQNSRLRGVYDSLRATMESIRNRQRQYDLLQSQFRTKLVESCDSFVTMARAMPPLAGASLVSSLAFLRAELAGKAVDNVEAMQRLAQVVRDLFEATMSVQDLQAAPPLPDIRTTASILRLGAIFQAAAGEKGAVAALWTGIDNNGNPRWTLEKNPKTAVAIYDAVAMRQGKELPAIVHLPINTPLPLPEAAQ